MNGLRNANTDGAIWPSSAVPLKNPADARFVNHSATDSVVKNDDRKPLTSFYNIIPALSSKPS